MVRAPCCEKMGLKKGPWTPEEDHVLVTYIQQYGHGNWRALPKLAGLLRCGKSCRLRWTNYLRPDIKRGNFSREEEDAIINLHQMLGNRWSAIAARLPGRTDNEIKNVWHTHLKKKLNTRQNPTTAVAHGPESEPKPTSTSYYAKSESFEYGPVSPPQCTTSGADDTSSFTTSGNNDISTNSGMKVDMSEANLPEADESFWSEVLSADQNSSNESVSHDFDQAIGAAVDSQVNAAVQLVSMDYEFSGWNMYDNCMDFWYNVFTRSGEIPELLLTRELIS